MTSREPKVSIGLPVYNGERYLQQTLECLLNQTFKDFEIIISDNASEDGTSGICRSYAARDDRVRYHRNERNVGAGRNFNRAFELARGKYFKWAAHDDLLGPDYLERCVQMLDSCLDAVLCQAGISQINEDGQRIVPISVPLVGADSPSPSHRFARNVLTSHSCCDIFGLIRSEALRGMPLHEGCLGTDRIILAELSLRGRFAHVPEPLFLHRDHPQRYVHTAFDDPEARTAWYDPSRAGDRLGQYLSLYHSYFAAVRRSAPTASARLKCYGYLLCWPAVQCVRIPRLKMYQTYGRLDPRVQAKIRKLKRFLLWWRMPPQTPAKQARPRG